VHLTRKPDQPLFTIIEVAVDWQWCFSAKCGRLLHVLTHNWTHSKQPANTPPPQSTTPSIHQMAPPEQTSDCSSLLIYRPRKDERL